MERDFPDSLFRLLMKIASRYHLLIPRKYQRYSEYLFAVVFVALALMVRLAIAPVEAGLQYVTFFPAITLAAIFGGFVSGLIATIVGGVVATYIFVPPYYSFLGDGWHYFHWSSVVFLMDGIVVSLAIETMHQFRRRYERNLNVVNEAHVEVMQLNEELQKQMSQREVADQALIEQEEFFRLIAENVDDFIAVLDLKGRRLYNSPSYARLFGSTETMKGTDSFAEIHPDDREDVKKIFNESVLYGIGLRTGYRFVLPDGSVRHMESSSGLIKNSTGEIVRVVVVSHDVTKRKLAEEEIKQLAFYDTLTQLPNRRLLDDRLEHAISASRRSGHYGAVMFLDLDNFKPLNDNYGHKTGDLLLVEVARRLKKCVREADTVARFGGDEFVVVLSELSSDESECIVEAGIVAKKILANLGAPYWLASNFEGSTKMMIHDHCGASIGVVPFRSTNSAENILKLADKAMYKAKEKGRNEVCFSDSES